jgi:hypothetical protein
MASNITTWSNSTTLPSNTTISGNTTTTTTGNSTVVWAFPQNAGRSLRPDIIACTVITLLIASAFVTMRFYIRGWVNHVLSPSDWVILPALVSDLRGLMANPQLTVLQLCAAGLAASSFERTSSPPWRDRCCSLRLAKLTRA